MHAFPFQKYPSCHSLLGGDTQHSKQDFTDLLAIMVGFGVLSRLFSKVFRICTVLFVVVDEWYEDIFVPI
jgi:hypothetical protein